MGMGGGGDGRWKRGKNRKDGRVGGSFCIPTIHFLLTPPFFRSNENENEKKKIQKKNPIINSRTHDPPVNPPVPKIKKHFLYSYTKPTYGPGCGLFYGGGGWRGDGGGNGGGKGGGSGGWREIRG